MKRFILSHKSDFDFILDNTLKASDYTILSPTKCMGIAHHVRRVNPNGQYESVEHWTDSERIPVKVIDGITNPKYGEVTAWNYILSQLRDGEYGSLCHYRREMINVPDGHVCVARPIYLNGSVEKQTAYYHSSMMMALLKRFLHKEDYKYLSESNMFFPYNIFSAPKQVIGEWCWWQNFFIKKMEEITGPDIEHFLRKNYGEQGGDTFTPRPYKNISVSYQSRFYAFVSERLNTVFWRRKMKENKFKIAFQNVRLMEEGQKI